VLSYARGPATEAEEKVKVGLGGPAPPFALKDTTGTLHRLEEYAGQWLLLIFHRHLR
jgi:peroxiredoxin